MERSRLKRLNVQLAELLLQLRKSQNLTQTELACRLGEPQSFVSKVEGCERRLDLFELLAYVEALGLEPNEVLSQVLGQSRVRSG